MFSRVLFPALREAGAGKQNAVEVIVVRRYARLVVIAGLDSPFYLSDYVENWQFLAIIDGHGYTFLPLEKRLYAVFISQKICNPFL